MRSSSTEHPSGGEPELSTGVGIERDYRSRGPEAYSSSNVQMESTSTSGKQKRDKQTSKAQQEEEEERGKLIKQYERKLTYMFLFNSQEVIRVYDGNATYRNGNPRSISVVKQATYTQILVYQYQY